MSHRTIELQQDYAARLAQALAYQPGLVAAWLERAGNSPWPKAQARAIAAPASAKPEGAAMAFTLKQDKPQLLGVTTSAPVVVAPWPSRDRNLPPLCPTAKLQQRDGWAAVVDSP